MQRIPHHADSEMARLDAEAHLRPNRHGEWGGAMIMGPEAGMQVRAYVG